MDENEKNDDFWWKITYFEHLARLYLLVNSQWQTATLLSPLSGPTTILGALNYARVCDRITTCYNNVLVTFQCSSGPLYIIDGAKLQYSQWTTYILHTSLTWHWYSIVTVDRSLFDEWVVTFGTAWFAAFPLIFTALQLCRRGIATSGPSVRLSDAWIVTKRKHLAKKVQLWLIGSRLRAFQWA